MVQRFHVIYEGSKKFHTCIYSLRYLPLGGIAPSNFWQNSENANSGYSDPAIFEQSRSFSTTDCCWTTYPTIPTTPVFPVAVFSSSRATCCLHSVLRPRHGEEDVTESESLGFRSNPWNSPYIYIDNNFTESKAQIEFFWAELKWWLYLNIDIRPPRKYIICTWNSGGWRGSLPFEALQRLHPSVCAHGRKETSIVADLEASREIKNRGPL